jgi:hypothetical protein
MINRGKPIYVTQETFLYATLIGLPTAGVSVLQTGQTTINPWVERAVHQGAQLGYQNNITLLTFDVPVAGSATTGVTFGAFGDFDGQTNWVSFLQGLVTTGFLKDHVIVSNYSDWDPVGTAILSPDVRLQTPLFDFGHPVDTTQPFGMHIPIEAQFNAAARVPLFFGESFLYPQDL